MNNFYSDSPTEKWRFGDVVEGFISIFPKVNNPGVINKNFNISFGETPYFVILTPCCSIKDKKVTLVPLRKLDKRWFQIDAFCEDYTVFNNPVNRKISFPTKYWENKLSEEERNEILNEEDMYTYNNYFFYPENNYLKEYEIEYKDPAKNIITNSYCIYFKDAFMVECNKIVTGQNPKGLKLIELTIETRDLLRDKLQKYYRKPFEDEDTQ